LSLQNFNYFTLRKAKHKNHINDDEPVEVGFYTIMNDVDECSDRAESS
jgi:hypothetical protein